MTTPETETQPLDTAKEADKPGASSTGVDDQDAPDETDAQEEDDSDDSSKLDPDQSAGPYEGARGE